MAGIPIEVLLADDDTRTVSYAPSATVFKYLRQQPRPDRHAGLLALGDPAYERPDKSSDPKPLPDHGLLVNMVAPGSNAAVHGLKPGDVSAVGCDLGLNLCQTIAPARRHDNRGACLDETRHDGLADAACATGDNRAAPFEGKQPVKGHRVWKAKR